MELPREGHPPTFTVGASATSRARAHLRSDLALFAVLAVAYALLALSAFELFGALDIGVTFFPPAGLTFTALLLLPRRRWPVVVAAIVVGEVTVDVALQGQGVLWSLGWATANVVEPMVGATVTALLAPAVVIGRRFAKAFLVGGLLVGPPCGAAIGATVLDVADQVRWIEAFPDIWVGDALGVLVVAPLLLVALRPGDLSRNRTTTADTLVVALVASVVCTVLVRTDAASLGYAAVPLLAIPAARYSSREVAVAGAVTATILTAATARGVGPWTSPMPDGAHAELVQQQTFLLVALGAAWLLKLEVLDRLDAVNVARDAEAARKAAEDLAGTALTLQRAIMPGALPAMAGAEAVAEYLPATIGLEVGGDWYDAIVADDGRTVTVLIGDVVGHNLAAAAAMGQLAAAARALVLSERGPAEILGGLDRLAEHAADARVASVACLRLDLVSGELRSSLAGHLPPLVRTGGGVVCRLDGALGPPLWVARGERRPEQVAQLYPGSAVVLYTDGLVERRSESLDDGLARLEAALAAAPETRAATVRDSLLDAVLADRRHEDDVALLCLTWRGGGASTNPV